MNPIAMSQIAKLLPPENVVVGLEASSKKRVFEQAGLLFENHHGIARSQVYDALFAREKLGSTGLGQGIAIPHGRIKGLKEARGAFMRLAAPVQFDAPDGKPVNHVFVLLVPEAATRTSPSVAFRTGADVLRQGFSRAAERHAGCGRHPCICLRIGRAPADRRTALRAQSHAPTTQLGLRHTQSRHHHQPRRHLAGRPGRPPQPDPPRPGPGTRLAEIYWARSSRPCEWPDHIREIVTAKPPALIIADGCEIPPVILAELRSIGYAAVHHRAAIRRCHRFPAALRVPATRRNHHPARRVHGRARHGRADHRRLRCRQERTGARADLARSRTGGRRRGRSLACLARHTGRTLPGTAQGFHRSARSGSAQHSRRVRRNGLPAQDAHEADRAPAAAASEPRRRSACRSMRRPKRYWAYPSARSSCRLRLAATSRYCSKRPCARPSCPCAGSTACRNSSTGNSARWNVMTASTKAPRNRYPVGGNSRLRSFLRIFRKKCSRLMFDRQFG